MIGWVWARLTEGQIVGLDTNYLLVIGVHLGHHQGSCMEGHLLHVQHQRGIVVQRLFEVMCDTLSYSAISTHSRTGLPIYSSIHSFHYASAKLVARNEDI